MKNNLMIFERKEQAVVSSRVIAERFDKQHQPRYSGNRKSHQRKFAGEIYVY
jgi:hypothetical protein